MSVLVDTSVWSELVRRPSPRDDVFDSLSELIQTERALIIGPIRQEVLSGIKTSAQFRTVQEHLRPFPDVELTMTDFERAAEFHNRCRAKGVRGSNTDFLICAVAARHKFAIFTLDRDFEIYSKILPIHLYQMGLP